MFLISLKAGIGSHFWETVVHFLKQEIEGLKNKVLYDNDIPADRIYTQRDLMRLNLQDMEGLLVLPERYIKMLEMSVKNSSNNLADNFVKQGPLKDDVY